jgi:ribosome-binding protein aMBF1 (putative translation factor)
MGTKLRDYLEGEGRPKTMESVRRRQVLARAYTLAVDLIELRRSRGLTQQQLAERSGVAQSEISRIERGAIHPTDTTWKRLAEALNAELRLVQVQSSPEPRQSPPVHQAAAVAANRGPKKPLVSES